MNLPIFFDEKFEKGLSSYILNEEESKHALKVLRLNEGAEIIITNGKHDFANAIISGIHAKKCVLQISSYLPADAESKHLVLAIAPTKNANRMEWLVEKAVEIGASHIYFIETKRSVRRILNLNRMQRILIEACKQSQKLSFPVLHEMFSFQSFLESQIQNFEPAVSMIAHCEDSERKSILNLDLKNQNLILLIGPEGDFTTDEIQFAQDLNCIPITFGSMRLRTETAALMGISLLKTFQS